MFNITSGMERAWAEMNKPKATVADIAKVEGTLGIKLPQSYVDFVTRFGFVVFGRDDERRWLFTYVMDDGTQREIRQRGISFLFNADKLLTIYRYMVSTDDPDDETRPMLPPGYLTIGSDSGHGRILLEIEGTPGRIWFWPQSDWRWGTEDNTRLGFVAENFEDFINGLRPDPL